MQLGIDSFAAAYDASLAVSAADQVATVQGNFWFGSVRQEI